MANCTGDSIVQKIEKTECIGNSLQKINYNFAGLDSSVCELQFFTTSILGANGLLKSENQEVVAATPGVDYTSGTIGLNGVLKSNLQGVVTAATPGVDYYVPNTILNAYNTTIAGTLSTSGTAWFDMVFAKKDIVAYSTSDERLKLDIKPINNSLEMIQTLKGVNYTWNTNLQNTFAGKDVGVIAQDVEKVLPEAVITREDGYKSVRYEKIIPLLIESIKELQAEVNYLKSKIVN